MIWSTSCELYSCRQNRGINQYKKKISIPAPSPPSWRTWTAVCQLKQVFHHPSQAHCVHERSPHPHGPPLIQSPCRPQLSGTSGFQRGCVSCTSWLVRAWLSASSWWEDRLKSDCTFVRYVCYLQSAVHHLSLILYVDLHCHKDWQEHYLSNTCCVSDISLVAPSVCDWVWWWFWPFHTCTVILGYLRQLTQNYSPCAHVKVK